MMLVSQLIFDGGRLTADRRAREEPPSAVGGRRSNL